MGLGLGFTVISLPLTDSRTPLGQGSGALREILLEYAQRHYTADLE